MANYNVPPARNISEAEYRRMRLEAEETYTAGKWSIVCGCGFHDSSEDRDTIDRAFNTHKCEKR